MTIPYDSDRPYDDELYSYDGYYLGAYAVDPCFVAVIAERDYRVAVEPGDYTAVVDRRDYSVLVLCSGPPAPMITWKPKHPAEERIATFDFAAELPAGTSITGDPEVTISLLSGTDPAPGSVLFGPPQVQGTKVLQAFLGGIDGARYLMQCKITKAPSMEVIVGQAILPVSAK